MHLQHDGDDGADNNERMLEYRGQMVIVIG